MNFLELLRRQRGLTLEALAEETRITPTALCRLENGSATKMSEIYCYRLRDYYGLHWSADAFLKTVGEGDVIWPV